ncbi:uncharacterized protein EKO05_0007087 [Ascochyta rabiei]|uniref:Uncharacterized protein n=1 Tax=Didymella rabiei TaxID=5454 RepID=A0A163G2X8_DIDRA|nr:uncharacterized protein EKO05_0007087 [Ascochyta rabiei]KZM24655.1 hypothetical protein ST47_g4164 [Ascochyta rabiei]UPX16699.1 hypothetical protein EKO05_0007087 [Ascochyta rabiei]
MLVKSPRKRPGFGSISEGCAQKKVRLPLTTDDLFGSAPTTVVVSEAMKTYFVHKTVIPNNSAFFSNALKQDWKKGVTRIVELPHVDSATFQFYLDWLYAGPRLNFMKDDDRVYPTVDEFAKATTEESPTTQTAPQVETHVDETPSVDYEWTRWHQCYELGNYFQDTDFKDTLIDIAVEKMSSDEEYTLALPGYIYPTSNAQSPHRKLAVDVKVWLGHSFQRAPKADHLSEFLADLIADLGCKARTRYVGEMGIYEYLKGVAPCKYHEYTLSTAACYLAKRAVD